MKTFSNTSLLDQFTGVNAGDTFNFLVSNGIADIQSVLVVPYLSASANNNMNPFLSPYSTAGATPDPHSTSAV